jgi:hypothetical protein
MDTIKLLRQALEKQFKVDRPMKPQKNRVLPSSGRHWDEITRWQKIVKETLREDKRDCRHFVINPYKMKSMLKDEEDQALLSTK